MLNRVSINVDLPIPVSPGKYYIIMLTYSCDLDPMNTPFRLLQGCTLFFLFLLNIQIVGTDYNHIIEAVLIGTHNLQYV